MGKSGGTATSVELRNAWQRAWAQFRTSQSSIDYVRASGLDVDDHRAGHGSEQRDLFEQKAVQPDIGQADGVEHAGRRLDHHFGGDKTEDELAFA